MKAYNVKQQGFTLIELVIVIIIIGIVAGVSSMMIAQGVTGSQGAEQQDAIAWQTRVALSRMEREIRTADPNKITTATSTQFIFQDADGNTVNYQLSGTQLLRNSKVLADDIGSFSFLYYSKTGTTPGVPANIRYVLIIANITSDGQVGQTYHATLMLRNG